MGPVAGKQGFAGAGSMFAFQVAFPVPCCSVRCLQPWFSCRGKQGGVLQSPAPTGPAKSEGERQRNSERHRCQSSRSRKRSVCFSCSTAVSSSLLPSPVPIPSPVLVPALPRAHWYKGLKNQDHFYSVGTKGFLCCNSSVQLCTRPSHGAQQRAPCMTATKADYCGDG